MCLAPPWSVKRFPTFAFPGFIEPCRPLKATMPPSGPLWVHEIKHDGYRSMVRRDCARLRCFTRNGNDWADRFLSIVEVAARLEAHSFLIDGEVVITSDDGTPDFHALRSRRRGSGNASRPRRVTLPPPACRWSRRRRRRGDERVSIRYAATA